MNRLIHIAILLLPVFMVAILPGTVSAAEAEEPATAGDIYEKSGAGGLYDSLDDDTKDLLSDAGIDSSEINGDFSFDSLLASLSESVRDKIQEPLKVFIALVAIIIITKICTCFDNAEVNAAAGMVGTLAGAVALAGPLIGLIAKTKDIVNTASIFLIACVPVYSALLVAGGGAVTGASYGVTTLAAGNAISLLSSALIIPLLSVFLALSVASSVSSLSLNKVTESIYKFAKWVLILVVTIFTAVISVMTVINTNIDAVSVKTVKVIASSAVPVVGGIFGDSLAAIQGSVHIVKNGVGAFGILASLVIFFPLILESVLWTIVCSAGEMVADLFDVPQISKFAANTASAAKMILAVVTSIAIVCVVCASVVVLARGTS